MEQATRNKLRNVVTQCRKLLEESVSQTLQGRQFGIYAGGKDTVHIEDESRMTHLSEEDQTYRRELLDHFEHIKARGFKEKDALDQLVREIAFTHLNRLCAYKMMEARQVYVGGQRFREAVSRGINSNGFKFYLADHSEDERLFNTGKQELAYRNFLDWLGGLLSEEIGVLFNPNDPANRLYPQTLDELLALINDEELVGIWEQDETIGWVYQYFTSKELRDKARKESQAPRNSYELAFRNQFFTPRYVVEFLTDNTLGRIWYEMRKGETKLKDQCRYMVRRPNEIFLDEGQEPPEALESQGDLSQEELLKQPIHIPHRPKKDPRELKILDPACGSGHFLLYCFDLLQTIYEEAYSDPDIGSVLQQDYPTLNDLRQDVPRLILAHNLHGIDIDLRASQIAALALWLRCQRAYQDMELKKDRPKISRSNLVCAEPMPGEEWMLKDFVTQLEPKLLGQLVEVVFDKMKLAGEAGSLLKIEEEIRDAVATAKKQWLAGPVMAQRSLFDNDEPKPQQLRFDFSGISDDEFFEQAESKVVEALRHYAEQAQNGERLQRRLFADDAMRGFALVDLCRQRFDAVLMNPPFGNPPEDARSYCEHAYLHWNKNILCAFFSRAHAMLKTGGSIGSVYDRTANIKNTYEDFRRHYFLGEGLIHCVTDLGWNVLDANVEVSAAVVQRPATAANSRAANRVWGADITQTKVSHKGNTLRRKIAEHRGIEVSAQALRQLPNSVIGYYFPEFVIRLFDDFDSLELRGAKVFAGHTIKSDEYFRYFWEIPTKAGEGLDGPWARLYNGGSYSRYFLPPADVTYYGSAGSGIADHRSTILRNLSLQQRPGVAFGKRGEFIDAHLLRTGFVSTVEGEACSMKSIEDAFVVLALLNSQVFQFVINQYCGQHKYPGYVNLFPTLDFSSNEMKLVGTLAREIVARKELASTYDETAPLFLKAMNGSGGGIVAECVATLDQLRVEVSQLETELNNTIHLAYQLDIDAVAIIDTFCRGEPMDSVWYDDGAINSSNMPALATHRAVSYVLGCVFGRWDIRYATEKREACEFPNPFESLPLSPPGMLQGPNKLAASEAPEDYPLPIDWDGILVDDPDHPDDIVRRVREALELIWKDRLETIEKEVCEILGMKTLRDYFRKPSKEGLWDDHVKLYTKSRRKAPIYWLLQSSKKNYALWLYYHRLDKDILFKALLNYVEPKIQREENFLNELRSQKSPIGDSGKGVKKLDREIEKQEDLLSELRDFEEKLREVANLHLDPDLNDGVVLNIAPLHELVPWNEARKYWDELIDGKYEWSSIGKQLRERGLVNGQE